MAKLFISYARRDATELARRLQADLKAQGHEAWLDKREIQVGSGWAASIESAIGGCDALLALLTAGSFESSICRGEQLRALRLNKRLLPLLVQPQADRPVYLEAQHYLDFSDAAAYAARMQELVVQIGSGAGVRLDALPAARREEFATNAALGAEGAFRAGGPADWADLVALCRPQFQRVVETHGPRGSLPGLYERELHVERAAAQAELERCAVGSAPGLLLVGEPGCGKTHLLLRWCESLREAGDAVLFYPGERVDALRLPGEIARDLGFEDGPELAGAWPRLQAMAAGAGQTGQRLWIVVDGLNDCRSAADGAPAADAARRLMLALDSLVSRLPGTSVRVVASCTQAAWQRMARPAAAQGSGLKLAWARYHQTLQRSSVLDLERYTAAEAEQAWSLQRTRLQLSLAWGQIEPGVQQRLTAPTLLRLLAESLRGQPAPDFGADLEALVFQRYLADRIGAQGRPVLTALAAEMLAQRSAALPYAALAAHPVLGAQFEQGQPSAALAELLDEGVLSEMPSDGIDDARLRFTYPQVGALAMVGAVVGDAEATGAATSSAALLHTARTLVATADDLPLAWEAALQLAIRRADDAQFCALASDADPDLRELALQSVVRLHGREPERARSRLALLLQSGSPEQQRTALRAIFGIGPAARDLLIRSALHGNPALKQAVRDTLYFIWNGASQGSAPGAESRAQALYFIWRRAPDFTRGLLEELVNRLTLKSVLEWRAILGFVLDLSIQIYVNHCERPDVIEQTATLFQRLTVEKLQLHKVDAGSMVEKATFGVVELVYAEQLLGWMLLDGERDARTFFAQTGGQRALLTQAAPLLDPSSDLEAAQELLESMLQSPVSVVRGCAALIVGVHAVADAGRAERTVTALFDTLDSSARSWLLAGYCVLLPNAPPDWTALLEWLTMRQVEEAVAAGEAAGPPRILPFFDALYVPLGLAYARQGGPMPYFETLLMDAAAQPAAASRLLEALGIVGFYHPGPVLQLLQPHLGPLLSSAGTAPPTLAALATVRNLHFEAVDDALQRADVADARRRDVLSLADPARVQQFMRLLGFYNNAVHLSVHYPRMRRPLAQGAMRGLATAASPREFITGYGQAAVKLARDAQFDLRRWTLPDEPAAPAQEVAHA